MDSLSTDDGLSYNKVFSIYQDRRGFIWIGTAYGLNRYDGAVFNTYYHDPHDSTTIRNNYIWTTLEDSYGNFWVGTADGLNRYDRIRDNFEDCTICACNNDSTRMFSVRVIMEDSFGEVWLGTTDGLKRYDRFNDNFFHYGIDFPGNERLTPNYVISIYEDTSNNLWIGTLNGLFKYHRKSDQLQFVDAFYRAHRKGGSQVTAIVEYKSGKLWLGRWGGYRSCLYDVSGDKMLPLPDQLNINGIMEFCEDRNHRKWIATEGGLFVLDLNKSDSHKFLATKKIRSVLEDNSGIIWVGTQHHGLYRFVPRFKKFENYEYVLHGFAGRKNYTVTAIVEDKNGSLWIGTEGGKIFRFNRKQKSYTFLEDIAGVKIPVIIHSLFINRDNELWFGSEYENTLFRYLIENNELMSYEDNFTRNEYVITALHEDANGDILCGTEFSGFIKFDRSSHKFTQIHHNVKDSYKISEIEISVIFKDRSGNFWMGTAGSGLYKYSRENRFIRYAPDANNKNSLHGSLVLSVYEDKSGNIWIGTANGGLNKLDPKTGDFEHFGINDDFPSSRILAIMEDEAGNLWISSSKGISKFNPNTLEIRNYNKSDGLLNDDFDKVSFCDCRSGEMVFGGKSGFTIFHPDSLHDNPYIPPVYVTDFKILNKPVQLDTTISEKKHITLSHHQNVFSFEFAALNYIHPEKNQYHYKMEGFDADWIGAGKRNYASYSNLSPGDYVFHVKASNNDGVWNNEGAAIRITITPPWWRTNVAYIFYVMMFISLIYGFYRFNMYRAGMKNELNMQRFEAKKMREIDEMKSNFFADRKSTRLNSSHYS